MDMEIDRRIEAASTQFNIMTARIWKATALTPNSKLQLYNALVMNTLLYACETWAITSQQLQRLEAFHNRCIRRMKGVTLLDHITTDQLHTMAPTTEPVGVWVRRAQLRWIGHLARREGSYAPKLMLFAHSIHCDHQPDRRAGRPPMSFLEQLHSIISSLSRPGGPQSPPGALRRVIEVAQRFGVMFKGLDSSYMSSRQRIDWVHVALNRVLWSRVVSLGAMDC